MNTGVSQEDNRTKASPGRRLFPVVFWAFPSCRPELFSSGARQGSYPGGASLFDKDRRHCITVPDIRRGRERRIRRSSMTKRERIGAPVDHTSWEKAKERGLRIDDYLAPERLLSSLPPDGGSHHDGTHGDQRHGYDGPADHRVKERPVKGPLAMLPVGRPLRWRGDCRARRVSSRSPRSGESGRGGLGSIIRPV
jgi:hypothetical protein